MWLTNIQESDMSNLRETVYEIKNIAKNAKEEALEYADAVRAKALVLDASLETKEDVFLYFSALNFLNSYVKKSYAPSDFKKNYFFKNSVSKGIDAILDLKLDNCSFCFGGDLVMVNMEDLLFSYHQAQHSPKMHAAKNEQHPAFAKMEWKGVRLQPIANTLFAKAKQQGISAANKQIIESIANDVQPSAQVKYANKTPLQGTYNKKKNKHHRKANGKHADRSF